MEGGETGATGVPVHALAALELGILCVTAICHFRKMVGTIVLGKEHDIKHVING